MADSATQTSYITNRFLPFRSGLGLRAESSGTGSGYARSVGSPNLATGPKRWANSIRCLRGYASRDASIRNDAIPTEIDAPFVRELRVYPSFEALLSARKPRSPQVGLDDLRSSATQRAMLCPLQTHRVNVSPDLLDGVVASPSIRDRPRAASWPRHSYRRTAFSSWQRLVDLGDRRHEISGPHAGLLPISHRRARDSASQT